MRTCLAIIHPRRLEREGLRHLLTKVRFSVVASGGNTSEVLAGAHEGAHIAVILCALADDSDIDEQVDELSEHKAALPNSKFVILTNALERDLLNKLIEIGVDAVLSQDISPEVLQRALQLVQLGEQLFPPMPAQRTSHEAAKSGPISAEMPPVGLAVPSTITVEQHRPTVVHQSPPQALADHHRKILLSEREGQILACLVNGASNKVIARELHIAEATVKVHIKGLLRKIRVNNRTQAAIWALNNTDVNEQRATPGLGRSIDGAVSGQAFV